MRHYVPEVHDVHPGTKDAIDDVLELLPEPARAACAVLVVPNWANAEPCDDDPRFADWLRRLPGEKVLHGYAHAAPATAWNDLWYGVPNESEFARLETAAAQALLSAGAEIFVRTVGARPRWFCAPRWHQSPGATAALRAGGFTGWMLRGHLVLAQGGRLTLPAVWFDDGERAWRRRAAGALRHARLGGLLRAGRTFRLVLHPRDVHVTGARREAQAVVKALQDAGWGPISLSRAAGQPAGETTSGGQA